MEKKEKLLVSIALATFNGEKFLERQLESLLKQTYTNFEIIISDDGSTDKTLLLLEKFAKRDPRIFFSKNPHPNGYKKNFERAISLCRGEIIFLCDQDDVWYPEKIAKHIKVYENKKIMWVYNEIRLIDENEKSVGLMTDYFKDYYSEMKLFYQTGGRCIIGCATSYRSKSIKNIWPISTLAPGHDSWIQLAVWPAKPFHIREVLQDYRQHANNAVGIQRTNKNNIDEDVLKSIKYVKELTQINIFPLWKRLIFFIFLCGKNTKFKIRTIKIKDLRFRIYYLTFFKIKTIIRRQIYSFFKFNRPSSLPFITGDAFRNIAEHIFDENSKIDPKSVMKGDIIFVRADLLLTYFKKVHPKIGNPYILISHNSDENIDERFLKYIDDKIIHWFAQNLIIEHPKCTPIPIGLQLRFYDKKNTIIKLIKKYRTKTERESKIFYAFNLETNKKRKEAINELCISTVATGQENLLNQEDYFSKLASYRFCASPEGGGIDCHRTWESLYMNTIPILEKNFTTLYWEKIELPIILIDSWSDIRKINDEIIIEFYEKLKERLCSPCLYMDYWIKEILKYKNE